ncbi:MAG: hypothetical protein KC729_09195 [Candidatus Eisenbacteria bacterium]|uniref:FlgD Ig-like domain-containing protein n=1 Tax=Eiseniibacteriota bacterium TaxID=2212470 RepID=A0A956RQP6_UNCEI|nr:hypothetical protein [Candidatus Eisenbacteria bacterium]
MDRTERPGNEPLEDTHGQHSDPSCARPEWWLSVSVATILTTGMVVARIAEAADLVWTDTDWSHQNYAAAVEVDPEVQPGILVLDNRVDDLRLVGTPTEFLGLYSMATCRDTLFLTASDVPFNDDGAEVIAYDYLTDSSSVVYRPYESGLHLISCVNDTLYLPGPDSMDPWFEEGSIYVYDGDEWIEKATIPTAIHVNDVAISGHRLFVTTGHGFGELMGSGCVWLSEDRGDTFTRVLTIEPTPERRWRRFHGAGVYHGRVYVQPDDAAPQDDRIFITSDGAVWDTLGIPNMPFDRQAMFSVYGDSLFMTIQNKMYIWDDHVLRENWLPFNGWRWCRGIHRYKGALYGGGDSCLLFRWISGSTWAQVGSLSVDASTEEIESMATYYGRLYVSTSRSDYAYLPHLFVSAAAPLGELTSLVHDFGLPVAQGVLDWDAYCPGEANRVRIQVRWGRTAGDLFSTVFVGPDGTSSTYFEYPRTILPPDHAESRYFQYRVTLACPGGVRMPVLRSVTLEASAFDPSGVEPADEEADHPFVLAASSPVGTRGHCEVRCFLDPSGGSDASLSEPRIVRLRILDAMGRQIRSLRMSAPVSWRWDLRDAGGNRVPSGMYWAIAEGPRLPRMTRTIVVVR